VLNVKGASGITYFHLPTSILFSNLPNSTTLIIQLICIARIGKSFLYEDGSYHYPKDLILLYISVYVHVHG
jgi:hypothetical protein